MGTRSQDPVVQNLKRLKILVAGYLGSMKEVPSSQSLYSQNPSPKSPSPEPMHANPVEPEDQNARLYQDLPNTKDDGPRPSSYPLLGPKY